MRISDEDVAKVLSQAEHAVTSAGIADDLRPAAFTAAIALFAADAPVPQGEPRRSDDSTRDSEAGKEHSALSKLARKIGVREDALAYIFEEDGGDLRLVVRRAMLPGSRAAAMRDVAQLLMAGRQASEIADWTRYDRLRTEMEELGVLDRPNFASEIQTLDVRLQGSRQTREARLTRHGLDEASAMIRRMIEGLQPSLGSD